MIDTNVVFESLVKFVLLLGFTTIFKQVSDSQVQLIFIYQNFSKCDKKYSTVIKVICIRKQTLTNNRKFITIINT